LERKKSSIIFSLDLRQTVDFLSKAILILYPHLFLKRNLSAGQKGFVNQICRKIRILD